MAALLVFGLLAALVGGVLCQLPVYLRECRASLRPAFTRQALSADFTRLRHGWVRSPSAQPLPRPVDPRVWAPILAQPGHLGRLEQIVPEYQLTSTIATVQLDPATPIQVVVTTRTFLEPTLDASQLLASSTHVH